jgi:hypothetical protein
VDTLSIHFFEQRHAFYRWLSQSSFLNSRLEKGHFEQFFFLLRKAAEHEHGKLLGTFKLLVVGLLSLRLRRAALGFGLGGIAAVRVVDE